MSSLDDARAALAAFDEEGRAILLRRLAGKRKSAPMNRFLPNGSAHVRAALAEVTRLTALLDDARTTLGEHACDCEQHPAHLARPGRVGACLFCALLGRIGGAP